jgi:glycosyltransferase involved in cell wall biosynthesis
MKTVGLYIPAYNAERTIADCIRAVLKQTYPVKDVVVVDDGSTDRTPAIVSRYPVRIIQHKKNRGLAAVRNTAIGAMKREFIASVDSDCLPRPSWLAALMRRFDHQKTCGVGGRLLERHTSSTSDLWRSVHMKQYWDDATDRPPFLFGSNTVFRRRSLIKVGLYKESLRNNYEDVNISQRLKKIGYSFIYERRAVVRHIKKDDLSSVLNTFWKWNWAYYKKRRFYDHAKAFAFKMKDNVWLANRFIEEDLAAQRKKLLYIDFLLGLHHSLRDFEYYVSLACPQAEMPDAPDRRLASWLNLIDLALCSRLQGRSPRMYSLIAKQEAFLQNFFALNLLVGSCINDHFKDAGFKKKLYSHLLASVYRIEDAHLVESLSNLVSPEKNWAVLLDKAQPNLSRVFLKSLVSHLSGWLHNITGRFSGLTEAITAAAD